MIESPVTTRPIDARGADSLLEPLAGGTQPRDEPVLISLVAFITLGLTADNFNPAQVFAALALFNVLRMPLIMGQQQSGALEGRDSGSGTGSSGRGRGRGLIGLGRRHGRGAAEGAVEARAERGLAHSLLCSRWSAL